MIDPVQLDVQSDPPSEAPAPAPRRETPRRSGNMAREMKVGLSIIVGLLIVLGGVIYYRVDRDAREAIAMKNKLELPAQANDGDAQVPIEPVSEVTRGGEPEAGGSSPWSENAPPATADHAVADAASASAAAVTAATENAAAAWTVEPQNAPVDATAETASAPAADAWPSVPAADPAFTTAPTADPSVAPATNLEPSAAQEPQFGHEAQELRFDDDDEPAPVAAGSPFGSPEPTSAQEPNLLAPSEAPPAEMQDSRFGHTQPAAEQTPVAPPSDDRWARHPSSAGVAPIAGTAAPVAPVDQQVPVQQPAPMQPPVAEHNPYNQAPATEAAPVETGVFDAQTNQYTVGPNENFWSISKRLYGSGGYFKALYEHNRRNYPFPNKLRAGDVIVAPPVSALEQTYPQLCPKRPAAGTPGPFRPTSSRMIPPGSRTYFVRHGDTLSDIARYELGRTSRWSEIYELNREVLGDDYNRLQPGTELVLPAETRPDRLTEAPGSGYQR